jgi:hypothetical protein
MEFSADWHKNYYKEEVANANHPEIRFFHIQKVSAPYPQQEVRGNGKCARLNPCIHSALPGIFLEGISMKIFTSPWD